MKKIFFTLFLTVITTAALQAQQISVVTPGGETSLYRTLPEAINGADPGSVIYLPGGGFSIDDSVKITKKLTIIGIGHKSKNDNVDGVTTISGKLFFNGGSSGSAVMGCYIAGDVLIGYDQKEVDNILIKNNYVKGDIGHGSNKCLGTTIDQNYINRGTDYHGSSGKVTNNIIHWVADVDNGIVTNNIIISIHPIDGYALPKCDNTYITNNVILSNNIHTGSNCIVSSNMTIKDWGENCINIGAVDWNNVFMNYNNGTYSSSSNFHFKEAYKQYESQVGVYANGADFDYQLAPVPYIVAKHIDQQTDAQGKLNVKIRVKAGQ